MKDKCPKKTMLKCPDCGETAMCEGMFPCGLSCQESRPPSDFAPEGEPLGCGRSCNCGLEITEALLLDLESP